MKALAVGPEEGSEETARLSAGVCLKTDPGSPPRPAPLLERAVESPVLCVTLWLEPSFDTQDLACIPPFFMRAQRGSLWHPTPATEDGGRSLPLLLAASPQGAHPPE